LYHLRIKETLGDLEQRKTGEVYDTSDNPFMTLGTGKTTDYGDPFPVYFDNLWHLYTLKGGLGAVLHLTSSDLVHWTKHAPAMIGSNIATGTVLKHRNRYYLFYTMSKPPQKIGLVISDNPWSFDKEATQEVVVPEGVYAEAHPFHDAGVFYNGQEKLYWMVLEAHTKINGKKRVDVALYKAECPEGPWKSSGAVYSHPPSDEADQQFVSCPEIFWQGDVWYLTYLNHGTFYHTSPTPNGPWGKPSGQYNSDFLTAGSRTVTDGRRRLCWGFFTYRPTPETDSKPCYSGSLGVGREMVFSSDHTIGVRPLPELVAAIHNSEYNADIFSWLKAVSGRWEFDAKTQKIASSEARSGVAVINTPEEKSDYYFETNITFGENEAPVSVSVRSTAARDSGYRVALRPGNNTFEITEQTGERRSYLTETHQFSKTANLKIFVCDGLLEAFVDDESDLSTRVLQKTYTKIIFETQGGNVSFSKPLLHYFKQTTIE
jgi:hypothetical protein